MIEINKKDIEDINKSFKKLSDIDKNVAFKHFVQNIYKDSIRGADKHTITGAMVASLYMKKNGEASYTIGSDSKIAPYSIFVHWGTKKHTIERKNKKALRFPIGGAFAFAKSVEHPGYDGDPFILNAIYDNAKKLPALFDKIIKEL